MKEHVYKIVELVGTSETGVTDAIETALIRAGETIRNIRWFEAGQIRGAVKDNKVTQYQVSLRIGFTIDD